MKKKVLAIIPARSGSKSIKNKNILNFLGKPLLAWTIEHCLKSKQIDETYLSTDSEKYANIARKYGLKNIILRPKNLSKDKSPDIDFILHAIKQVKYDYEYIAHLRPTTPVRNIKMIDRIITYFKKNSKLHTSLRTVHEEPETSYKSFEIKNNKLKPLKNLKLNIDQLNSPRQFLTKTYSANGVLDLYKKNHVLKKKKLFGNKVLSYIIPFTPELDTKDQINLLKIYAKNKNIK